MENKNNRTTKTASSRRTKQKKSTKFSFKKLLSNNKILLLISFLLAFGFWIVYSQNSTEETTVTISDIPIVVDLPDQAKQDGYKIYSGADKTASVQIKGNRLTVGTVTKDDIQVAAQDTSSMTSSNNYPLSLVAKKIGVKADYEIIFFTPNVVNYFVDKERVKTFNVENDINTVNVKIPSDYYLGKPVLSADQVVVTGPETEVKKIEKVAVTDTIEGDQSSTITKSEKVVLLDSDGEQINSEYLKVEPESIDTTIQILPEKKVKVNVSYANVPSGIDATSIVSVSPTTITIAGPQNQLNTMSSIDVGTVDFSRLLPTIDKGSFNISLPEQCINISNQLQANVSYDFTGYASKTITISNITMASMPSGYSATVTSTSMDITVVGPEETVDSLSASNISAVADLSAVGQEFIGSVEVPVNITINNAPQCWVYKLNATGYTANVNVEKTGSSTVSSS